MKIQEQISTLQEYINSSSNIVFFGGAGVSTESGIPDFRSKDGLYNFKWSYPPEEILSSPFFDTKPDEFYRFYREKILFTDTEPNMAHKKLAEMEEKGKLKAVITQNIDGLHQKAGSKNVYELHGSILRNYCRICGEFHDAHYVKNNANEKGIPLCSKCKSTIKPDVVLYGESLKSETVDGAIKALQEADLLIIGGTSLTVYPAAGFISEFKGKHIVLINKGATRNDSIADLVIHGKIGEVLGQINV